MGDELYNLITLNKDYVEICSNPESGIGPLLCDTQCRLDINYNDAPINLENIDIYVNRIKKYIKLTIHSTDNHILYKGGNSASIDTIKTENNIISDKYILKFIYIFFNAKNNR